MKVNSIEKKFARNEKIWVFVGDGKEIDFLFYGPAFAILLR